MSVADALSDSVPWEVVVGICGALLLVCAAVFEAPGISALAHAGSKAQQRA